MQSSDENGCFIPSGEIGPLLDDITTLIDQARQQVAVTVNTKLTRRYWLVGQRICTDTLPKQDRATDEKRILAALSQQLSRPRHAAAPDQRELAA